MASLKEIKNRIASISSTRKITSAMKMVASAKLHKAQRTTENMIPYEAQLTGILNALLCADMKPDSPYLRQREVKRVAIVVFSSNTSLAGAFNANVIRLVTQTQEAYRHLGNENVWFYPVGTKVNNALKKLRCRVEGDFSQMAGKPSYQEASGLAATLMELFRAKEIDRVELIYTHFHSTAVQNLVQETFLPIKLNAVAKENPSPMRKDYIVEPSPQELVQSLLPKVLRLKLYTVLLDSNTAEHAARTMAMQIATDNANNMIQELTQLYNKSRQQSITNELQDIIGGSMA